MILCMRVSNACNTEIEFHLFNKLKDESMCPSYALFTGKHLSFILKGFVFEPYAIVPM